jgi:ribosomal protein S18 acetylase RimI-like enzyme
MNFKLKDGRVVEIAPFNSNIPVESLMKFINDFVDENLYLVVDHHYSLKEDEKWKKERLKKIKDKKAVIFVALSGKRVVGIVSAIRERMKLCNNVGIEISISKDFRGVGLGEKMLRLIISEAKKKLKPKNIYLTVAAENKPAIRLYKKVGFKKVIGRYQECIKHKGKYIDQLVLLLVGKWQNS